MFLNFHKSNNSKNNYNIRYLNIYSSNNLSNLLNIYDIIIYQEKNLSVQYYHFHNLQKIMQK